YITTIAPFLVLPMLKVWPRVGARWWATALAAGLLIPSLVMNLVSGALYPHCQESYDIPVFNLSFPLIDEGYAPYGLGWLLHLPGRWALAPLAIVALAAVSLVAAGDAPPAPRGGAALGDARRDGGASPRIWPWRSGSRRFFSSCWARTAASRDPKKRTRRRSCVRCGNRPGGSQSSEAREEADQYDEGWSVGGGAGNVQAARVGVVPVERHGEIDRQQLLVESERVVQDAEAVAHVEVDAVARQGGALAAPDRGDVA